MRCVVRSSKRSSKTRGAIRTRRRRSTVPSTTLPVSRARAGNPVTQRGCRLDILARFLARREAERSGAAPTSQGEWSAVVASLHETFELGSLARFDLKGIGQRWQAAR